AELAREDAVVEEIAMELLVQLPLGRRTVEAAIVSDRPLVEMELHERPDAGHLAGCVGDPDRLAERMARLLAERVDADELLARHDLERCTTRRHRERIAVERTGVGQCR